MMIKKIAYTLFIWMSLAAVANGQSLVNTNSLYVSDGTIYITGDYINQSSGNIVFNSSNTPKVALTGDITNNASGKIITTAGTNGTFVIAGSSTQTLNGTSTADFDFEKFIVNTGATFEIPAADVVTIKNDLTIDGSFSVLSTSSSTGSLIVDGTVSGTGASSIEVQRYLTADRWYIVSSPFTDETIGDFITNSSIPTGGGVYAMMDYSESTGWSSFFTMPNSNTMTNGKGYMTRLKTTSGNISFKGTIETGNVNFNITRSNYGWNCVGNPYTSSIGINNSAGSSVDFLVYNSDELDPLFTAAYVWNEQSGYSGKNRSDYVVINHATGSDSANVQSSQGFIVRSVTGGGTVTFTPDMQLHQSQTFYKKSTSSTPEKYQIKLIAEDENNFASTKVFFMENTTSGLDPGYDAGLFGALDGFSLYTRLADYDIVNFMIQCLPNNDFSNASIAVGIDYTDGGLVTFSAETIDLPFECLAILEDRELGIFTDLKTPDAEYVANIPAGNEGTGRFFLHTFDAQTSDVDIDDLQNITIFAFNKEIIVQGKIAEISNIKVYDISGRMVKQAVLENSYRNTIPASDLKEGIYIIHLQVGNKIKTSKLFLR